MNKRWTTPLFFLVLIWLFYVASKGAYKGFFSADDLDNLAWTRHADLSSFLTGLLTPLFSAANFRPVGHFYFWALGHAFGLDFRPYVAVLHLLHLANLGLLWALLSRLQFAWPARAVGVVFFAFHMAVFDAYWKPMYIFDVSCAFFSLLSVLLWLGQRPWLSLLSFWFAYKSKELAVAIPAILAAYELLLGSFSFRALSAHIAGGAWFIGQALFAQSGRTGGEYAIRLTPLTLWQTADYYASQILLVPHAGFGLLFLPAWLRDRRLWWGLLAALLWLGPMFAVPGRTFGAYLYLPLAGLAVAMAAVTERAGWKWIALPMTIWLVFNYAEMRNKRRATLAEAEESSTFVRSLSQVARNARETDTILLDGVPDSLQSWGIQGAIRYAFDRDDLTIINLRDTDHPLPGPNANIVMLSWDASVRRLFSVRRTKEAGDVTYMEMTRLTPVWLLGEGWYQWEGNFRWTKPRAFAAIRRPEDAKHFSVTVNIGPGYIQAVRKSTLTVLLNGVELGSRTFTEQGWRTETFNLPDAPPGPANVEFRVDPPFIPSSADPRPLGIPIGGFGFR